MCAFVLCECKCECVCVCVCRCVCRCVSGRMAKVRGEISELIISTFLLTLSDLPRVNLPTSMSPGAQCFGNLGGDGRRVA